MTGSVSIGQTSMTPTFAAARARPVWLLPAAVLGVAFVIALIVSPDVPSWLDAHVQQWARDRYSWTIQNSDSWIFTWIFDPISTGIDKAVRGTLWMLQRLRWPGVIAVTSCMRRRACAPTRGYWPRIPCWCR